MRKAIRFVPYFVALAVLAGTQVAASPYDPVFQVCNAAQQAPTGSRVTTSPPAQFLSIAGCCQWAAQFACGIDTECLAYDYQYCMMTHPGAQSVSVPEPPDDGADPEILP